MCFAVHLAAAVHFQKTPPADVAVVQFDVAAAVLVFDDFVVAALVVFAVVAAFAVSAVVAAAVVDFAHTNAFDDCSLLTGF